MLAVGCLLGSLQAVQAQTLLLGKVHTVMGASSVITNFCLGSFNMVKRNGLGKQTKELPRPWALPTLPNRISFPPHPSTPWRLGAHHACTLATPPPPPKTEAKPMPKTKTKGSLLV